MAWEGVGLHCDSGLAVVVFGTGDAKFLCELARVVRIVISRLASIWAVDTVTSASDGSTGVSAQIIQGNEVIIGIYVCAGVLEESSEGVAFFNGSAWDGSFDFDGGESEQRAL